jgi:hypothetical protein
VDDKLNKIGYQKCDSARSVYVKKESDIVRLLRHYSDDFRLSFNGEERATVMREQVLGRNYSAK